MRGVVLFATEPVAVLSVIGGLNLRFGGHASHHLLQRFGGYQRPAFIFQRQANVQWRVAVLRLRQRALLNKLIQNSIVQNVRRQLPVLIRKGRICDDHMPQSDLFTVDAGDHGIDGLRGRGRRRQLEYYRQRK